MPYTHTNFHWTPPRGFRALIFFLHPLVKPVPAGRVTQKKTKIQRDDNNCCIMMSTKAEHTHIDLNFQEMGYEDQNKAKIL